MRRLASAHRVPRTGVTRRETSTHTPALYYSTRSLHTTIMCVTHLHVIYAGQLPRLRPVFSAGPTLQYGRVDWPARAATYFRKLKKTLSGKGENKWYMDRTGGSSASIRSDTSIELVRLSLNPSRMHKIITITILNLKTPHERSSTLLEF